MNTKIPLLILINTLILSSLSGIIIQESDASENIILDVDNFVLILNQWILTGSDPYLDAQGDGNMANTTTEATNLREFQFEDLPDNAISVSSVVYYVYCDPDTERLRNSLWNGTMFTIYLITGSGASYRSVDISDYLDTVDKVNGLRLQLRALAIGGWDTSNLMVDHVYLDVTYEIEPLPLLTSGQEYSQPIKSKFPIFTVLALVIFFGTLTIVGMYKKYN